MKQCPNCNSPNPDDSTRCSRCGAELTGDATPQSDGFVERLRTEVDLWQAEKLIVEEQARAILARYGLVENETAATVRHSTIASIIAVLGVVLVGIGVILMMGANWDVIPKWLRFGILAGSTAAAYLGGYRLAHGPSNYPKVGMALMLLGSMLWGASIMLIGQMFSTGGEGGERTVLLYWFSGTLPLAYVLRSPLHMGLSTAIGTVWFIWLFSENDHSDGSPFIIFLFAIGVLLCSLSALHSLWDKVKALAPPLRTLGLGFVFVGLYAFSFTDFWGYGFGGSRDSSNAMLTLLTAAAALLVGAIAIFDGNRRQEKASVYEALGTIGVLVVGAVLLSIGTSITGTGHSHHDSGLYLGVALLSNIVLLASEVGVIALGWYSNRPGLINFGLAVFVLQVITRYFDTLAGMLQGGVVFILAGLLLIPIAVAIERTRRRLVASALVRRTV